MSEPSGTTEDMIAVLLRADPGQEQRLRDYVHRNPAAVITAGPKGTRHAWIPCGASHHAMWRGSLGGLLDHLDELAAEEHQDQPDDPG